MEASCFVEFIKRGRRILRRNLEEFEGECEKEKD
jgi:hypothetical protein